MHLDDPDPRDERQRLFREFLRTMEARGIAYCLLGNVTGYATAIPSDVDFLVSERDLPAMPAVALEVADRAGGRLVQCLQHEIGAAYYAVCTCAGARVTFLHLDASGDYRRRGRLWLAADALLARRIRNDDGLWVPAPPQAFLYYLVKRIDKQSLDAERMAYLRSQWALAPAACEQLMADRLGLEGAQRLLRGLHDPQAVPTADELATLRAELHRRSPREALPARWGAAAAEARRWLRRVMRPTGLVVGFLGPDGSGKSTLIQRFGQSIEPAFRRRDYFHLRPNLLIRRRASSAAVAAAQNPHAQVPRSAAQSVAKAGVLWLEYGLGWLAKVWPLTVRSSLVIFDRYFHDMLADPRRYRWGGPMGLLRGLARAVPAPQLWIVLDAPVEVLQARKNEVTAEASAAQREAYRALAATLPGALLVDTSRDIDDCAATVNAFVLAHLENRTRGRLGLAARPDSTALDTPR